MKLATSSLALRLAILQLILAAATLLSSTAAASPLPPQLPPQPPIFVDASATGLGTGLDWTNAYTSLDTALASVTPGRQVWAAEGVYYPASLLTGFLVPADVKLFGGFVGTESSVDRRAGSALLTVLEGATPWGTALHVVTIATNPAATGVPGVTLDGFLVQHGDCMNDPLDPKGGGISCRNTDLDLVGCYLKDNRAQFGGGLMFEEGMPSSGFWNVLRIKFCEFNHNFADFSGGAIWSQQLTGYAMNNRFLKNSAWLQGGGVNLQMMGVNPFNFTNCEFWWNWVVYDNQGVPGGNVANGGAIMVDTAANCRIVNSTFSDNWMNDDSDGQAVYVNLTGSSGPGLANIYNSIFAFNGPAHIGARRPINLGPPAQIAVEYSDTWWIGVVPYPGNGNIALDPKFRDHMLDALTLRAKLQGQSGSSPCVDHADHSRLGLDVLDLDGDGITNEPIPIDLLKADRFVDRWEPDQGAPTGSAYLDMGAYERPLDFVPFP